MRKWTEFEQAMIDIVMRMAYQQGIEEGKKRALRVMKDVRDLEHPTIDDLPDEEADE